jgi:acetyltransferase-like isoleucine patch superfamily enzyme
MKTPWIQKTPARYAAHCSTNGEPYFVHEMAALGESCTVGRYSYIHGNTRVTGEQPVSIGNFCSIASGVRVHSGDEHDVEHVSTFPFRSILGLDVNYEEVRGDGVVIENDVWIGEGARILSGAKIGNGSIIGAGSIIKNKIESYGIYGGNPAKLIRMRFSDHKIEVLSKLGWWNWSLEKIRVNINFISTNMKYLSDNDFDEVIIAIR